MNTTTDTPTTVSPDWKPRRAPECDTAAREANIDGLLMFIIMRHTAWEAAPADNPHKAIYLEARDNAVRELKWRVKELWHENDTRNRHAQRLVETLEQVRGTMTERAAYEKFLPESKIKLFW